MRFLYEGRVQTSTLNMQVQTLCVKTLSDVTRTHKEAQTDKRSRGAQVHEHRCNALAAVLGPRVDLVVEEVVVRLILLRAPMRSRSTAGAGAAGLPTPACTAYLSPLGGEVFWALPL